MPDLKLKDLHNSSTMLFSSLFGGLQGSVGMLFKFPQAIIFIDKFQNTSSQVVT